MPSNTSSPALRATAPTLDPQPTSTPMKRNPSSRSSSSTRRPRPSHVQTGFLPSISSHPTMPTSAISASSLTSSSLQASPIMSPETALLFTNNSSIQGSPDGPRGRDADFIPPPFELPESIVSRKSSQSAMSEAIAASKSPGLIRRLSNRASQFAGRRRQSSTTAMSRDHSNGPVIMRRRSDSTNTAPEGRGTMFSDSDDDVNGDYHEGYHLPGTEGFRDFPSTTASIGSSITAASARGGGTGPVIPSILLQGTNLTKVTKKKKQLLTFVLENEAAKVSWDKNRPSKSFYIDNIKDIRIGADASNYRQEFGVPQADEPRFFSILYVNPEKSKSKQQKIMHLIADDDQTFELWITTLDAISKHRQDLMASLSSFHDKAVRSYWRSEMNRVFQDRPHAEDEEMIDVVGVERLCRSLHIHGSSLQLRNTFDQADVTRTGRLNFNEFQEFVKLMKRRKDIGAIYSRIGVDSNKGLTSKEFMTFLTDIQEEDVSADQSHWDNVFAKFSRRSKTKEQAQQDLIDGEAPRMNEAALSNYLISTFNVPLHNAPAPNLDRPMNEYFISSSHNTYLLGRQVAGQSSVEAYISALNKGCRCVEVDCWDGKDAPVVMHGRTLTSQVSFRDVMATISKYAFVKSSYPLWISLEVHCSASQQVMMAQIIKETCGSKLVTQPIEGLSTEQLPTPTQLMNKILIKVKKPRMTVDTSVTELSIGRSRGSSLSSPYIRPQHLDNSTIPSGPLLGSPYPTSTVRMVSRSQSKYYGSEGQESLSSSTSDSESYIEDAQGSNRNYQKHKTSNIVKVLGELGVYSVGLKFRGFDNPESKTYNHIFSFMEKTFDGNTKDQEDRRALMRHNMRHMMRVYPNGWRVASTNFDPLRYWRRGVQMTALNWQTYDLGMQMNDAMFASGRDQSGYVLKPSDLREIKMMQTLPEEAGADHVKRERKNVNFSIDVISAQQLMRPPPKVLASHRSVDPYVEVEVYHADDKDKDSKGVIGEGGLDASGRDGTSGLGTPHRRRTQIIRENGFNPVFDNKFNFDLTTKYPDLVFVRWTVRCSQDGQNHNDKAPILATYTAKLSSLQQGYRTLPLFDSNGDQFLFSTLFCRVKVEPITSIYIDEPENVTGRDGVFRTIRQNVFSRNPMSPKPSVDSGSFESQTRH